ncbi:MAG: aminotransferase class V-fold PLP-dependent enzyme [Acidobacteria bacterium]|nr:aminotransferase class V-fold PLP-dependent enzyme [Acidobacteriota bacterium]MBV9475650.1 aminotransferase class V-fold PLP-dependent enzyme [Acidobacteriota bacterium]
MLTLAVDTRSRDAAFFAGLRAREFARLDAQRLAYLDYTGSALYAESQLYAHHALLRRGIFGNPHSDSAPSRASTDVIDAARRRVLRHFDVDERTHAVIFTANTSAAVKLVAESYPFDASTSLVLSSDNHNSVLGIREYAARAGAAVHAIALDEELRLRDARATLAAAKRGLFAFPAQSNFSGVRHPLALVSDAHRLGFDVLLDAAAYVPSHALSLRDVPADFTALSFYKLFGYPTGLGALIARRDALAKLRRPWFAGGTVLFASVAANTHRLRPGHEAFEDGTPDFLNIAALDAGFDLLDGAGMPRIAVHVAHLTELLLDGLLALHNVRVYGPRDLTARGGTIAFNIRGVPYWDVEAYARERGVALRGGCFCNPGASEAAFGIETSRLRGCLETLGADFTPQRLAACAGTVVGAVRASLGLANNEADVARALDVIASLSR